MALAGVPSPEVNFGAFVVFPRTREHQSVNKNVKKNPLLSDNYLGNIDHVCSLFCFHCSNLPLTKEPLFTLYNQIGMFSCVYINCKCHWLHLLAVILPVTNEHILPDNVTASTHVQLTRVNLGPRCIARFQEKTGR